MNPTKLIHAKCDGIDTLVIPQNHKEKEEVRNVLSWHSPINDAKSITHSSVNISIDPCLDTDNIVSIKITRIKTGLNLRVTLGGFVKKSRSGNQ